MSERKAKEIRLHEGELNVMELLWSNKVLAAKDISKIIKEYIGWEKNTTYTYIKRLIRERLRERILAFCAVLRYPKNRCRILKPGF